MKPIINRAIFGATLGFFAPSAIVLFVLLAWCILLAVCMFVAWNSVPFKYIEVWEAFKSVFVDGIGIMLRISAIFSLIGIGFGCVSDGDPFDKD